jgi:hypothetical protein
MKFILIICYILGFSYSYSQKSEDLIPSEAVTVFSLNNIKLLQKISLDQLVQYDFMEELQQELFDGSTNNKTMKESGLDFNQKLNIFLGNNSEFSVSGISFGVENKSNLFSVFDDFKQIESEYTGVDWYDSYINNLLIKDNQAILLRIEPNQRKIDLMTDSIWYARGNASPWDYWESEENEGIDSLVDEEITDEGINEYDFVEEDEEGSVKNYFELRDSIQFSLQQLYEKQILDDLFLNNKRLVLTDKRFAEQMLHETEGMYYFDYSRKLEKKGNLFYFQGLIPTIFSEVNELYDENILTGDLVLVEDHLEFQMETKYNDKLGSIYSELADAKLDKSIRTYISKSSPAYFIYKSNLKEAYEKAYEILMPILRKENTKKDLIVDVMVFDLLNDFIDKDALFDTYKGSVFGTFNGVKKIKTKKIEYVYDDESFNYYEKETDAEEDIPVFTFGLSTKRPDIPAKILSYLTKINSGRKYGQISYVENKNGSNYYVMDKAILNSAPLYMINKNGLFILTNDEDLAKNHTNGYDEEALSSKELKKAEKGGLLYAKMDLNSTVNQFPRDVFSARENETIDALRGKTGKMEITTTKTTKNQTNLNLVYDFNADSNGPGTHILDLINAIFVLTK